MNHYPTSDLNRLEELIFDNQDQFIKKFCPEHTMDLSSVYFGSKWMKFNFILHCGQHITDEIPVTRFLSEFVDPLLQEGAF